MVQQQFKNNDLEMPRILLSSKCQEYCCSRNVIVPVLENPASNLCEGCPKKQTCITWTSKNTKLLLELYSLKKDNFRNPKTQKKILWREISDAMINKGYEKITPDYAHKKFTNFKARYTIIK